MKIRCVNNSVKNTGPEIENYFSSSGPIERLMIQKEYIVYAISNYYNSTWYCICDEKYTYHPNWFPEVLFKTLDQRLSKYWVYSLKEDYNKNRLFIGFPELANEEDFHDNLMDAEEREVEIFRAYKKLMDLEFPNPSITEVAEAFDDRWLYCSSCTDAWENSDKSIALVVCPKCSKVMKNPRYENSSPNYQQS